MAANKPLQMKEFNGTDWDNIFPKTIADQVGTSTDKQFASQAEKDAWNAKLAASAYTAADILTKLKTVDGAGTGLDADLLDGKEAAAFQLVADMANYLSKSGGTLTGFLTLHADPTSDLHAVPKKYVDGLLQGLNVKPSCKVATAANITLSAAQTIDGIAVVAGDRVLVKNQTAGAENGIYVVQTAAWTRATDADTSAEVKSMFTFIEQGTANADTGWVLTTDSVTLGTTALTYTQFSGAGSITAGTGLVKSGNTLSIDSAKISAWDGKAEKTVASTSANGLMSSTDKTKLDGIASGAEVNQNAFSKVVVGGVTIDADTKTDTLEIVAGSNITLTPDATNDKLTIAATNTIYSAATQSAAGLMSAADKTKLDALPKITVGATAPTSPAVGHIWLDTNNT